MIELQHLTKRFATQGGTVVALNDINLTIRDGQVDVLQRIHCAVLHLEGLGKVFDLDHRDSPFDVTSLPSPSLLRNATSPKVGGTASSGRNNS